MTDYTEKALKFYPSEESRIPWRTDLNALAAVALIHITKPKKWKLGSPCHEPRKSCKFTELEKEKHILFARMKDQQENEDQTH